MTDIIKTAQRILKALDYGNFLPANLAMLQGKQPTLTNTCRAGAFVDALNTDPSRYRQEGL
jgi:hypothetical protein